MPIKQGNKLIELRGEVVKGLEIDYQLGLRTVPDHLNYAGIHRGSILIKDTRRNLISEIIYKDELLYCNSPDSSSECEHTRFATSLIDVAKYMQEK
jgi:hypothetical protein